MKKIVIIIIIVLLLITGVFILAKNRSNKTGDNNTYKKEFETYTINREEQGATLNFELAKDLGYEFSGGDIRCELRNNENLSTISIGFLYDYKSSSTITKKEEYFSKQVYSDFENKTVAGHEGWSIYKRAELLTEYETGFVLTEKDADGKVYAVSIDVRQSPLEEGKSFNTEEFVNSEDFQHLLESFKCNIPETQEVQGN